MSTPTYPRHDTWIRCQLAHRSARIKLGPALGLTVLRSGLSITLITEALGQGDATFYDWIFGRRYPQRTKYPRIWRLTELLERGLAAGDLPRPDTTGDLEAEREVFRALHARHHRAVAECTPKRL
jgi:hypothetical protein